MLQDGLVGVRTKHILCSPHAFTSQYCIPTSLVSTFHAIILLLYACFFQFLGACDQHTTKCHLHMGICPEDREVTTSMFNLTCSLLPSLSSTKLELCHQFLYQVTGSLLPYWPRAQMPVTKSHHSSWKDICIFSHCI